MVKEPPVMNGGGEKGEPWKKESLRDILLKIRSYIESLLQEFFYKPPPEEKPRPPEKPKPPEEKPPIEKPPKPCFGYTNPRKVEEVTIKNK